MELSLPEKHYYSIGEVAQAFGVTTSKLRFWEEEFKEIKPKRIKNQRRYSPQDVETLKLIFHLVEEKGYTLEGAKQYLKAGGNTQQQHYQALEKLKKVKADRKSVV